MLERERETQPQTIVILHSLYGSHRYSNRQKREQIRATSVWPTLDYKMETVSHANKT